MGEPRELAAEEVRTALGYGALNDVERGFDSEPVAPADIPGKVAIDLELDLPKLGGSFDWVPTGSPLAEILLVAGGSVMEDPRRATWPDWRRDDSLPTWRDFGFVSLAESVVDVAVAVPLVPVDNDGNAIPGVLQWCVGEATVTAGDIVDNRIAVRVGPGPCDVVIRMHRHPRATLVPRLVHMNARGWLPAVNVDQMGSAWPSSADRFRERSIFPVGRYLPIAERSFPVELDAVGELSILGAPAGLVWRDAVEVVGVDGVSSTGLVAAGTAGRIESSGSRAAGFQLGVTSTLDISDSVTSLLPRFEFDADPSLADPESLSIRLEIRSEDPARSWIASGTGCARAGSLEWTAASTLSLAVGRSATLHLSGPGIADVERSLRILPHGSLRLSLRPPVDPVRMIAELPAFGGSPIPIPIRCSYRVASRHPVFKVQRWMERGASTVCVAEVDGQAMSETSGARMDVEIDVPALEMTLKQAWRSVYGEQPSSYVVWVERDLASTRGDATDPYLEGERSSPDVWGVGAGGSDPARHKTLDEARRAFRQRVGVRVFVTDGELRRSLADFVVERQLVEAFRVAAAG